MSQLNLASGSMAGRIRVMFNYQEFGGMVGMDERCRWLLWWTGLRSVVWRGCNLGGRIDVSFLAVELWWQGLRMGR